MTSINNKIFIVIDICFLIAFAILLAVDDNVPWNYVIVVFAMGWTIQYLLKVFRDSKQSKRMLR